MASKLLKCSSVAKTIKCAYGVHQPAVTKGSSVISSETTSDGIINSKLSTNTLVFSADPVLPVSSISFVYRSGSRFENPDIAGVSQLMRLSAGLRTQNITAFMHCRALQQAGVTIKAISSRETIQYSITGIVHDNVQAALNPLMEIATMPAYRPWEVKDLVSRLKTEIAVMEPSFITIDLLHRAAYHAKGLGRTIFTPDYMLDKLTCDDLMEFHANTHTLDRLSIVGLGCNHKSLDEMGLKLLSTGPGQQVAKSIYLGGEERRDAGNICAYIAIAGNGASIGSQDAIELMVLQQLLRGEPNIKFGHNMSNPLLAALVKAGGAGEIYPINANYSDGGLFGFFMILEPKHIEKVTREVYSAFKNLKINKDDLEGAKKEVRRNILTKVDDIENLGDMMAMQSTATGKWTSPLDVIDAVQKVSVSSVEKAFKKVTSSKISMSAYGNVEDVPYIQFL